MRDANDHDKILDKIKKCLALSSSSNEHEAAIALRQAQKLMELHGISDIDVKAAQAQEKLSTEEISKFLYTAGQPDPELLIRTSGEQRLGGFLLWQSALSEFYFCEAYWPDFRRVDFLRALRAYSLRQRRLGN